MDAVNPCWWRPLISICGDVLPTYMLISSRRLDTVRRCAVRTARITRDHMHGCCQSLMVETTDLYTWRRPPYLILISPRCLDTVRGLDGGDVLPTYILISSRCLDTVRGRCAVRTARMTRNHMHGSYQSLMVETSCLPTY